MRRIFLGSDHFSVHLWTVLKALTVSEAKPRLGALLDQVSRGREVYFRRKKRLYRVEEVTEIVPIPQRSTGYFSFDGPDELTGLADGAEVTFPSASKAEKG